MIYSLKISYVSGPAHIAYCISHIYSACMVHIAQRILRIHIMFPSGVTYQLHRKCTMLCTKTAKMINNIPNPRSKYSFYK
jgi:hypothetical protein